MIKLRFEGDTMAMQQDGIKGERLACMLSRARHQKAFQPDLIVWDTRINQYILIEAKYKKLWKTKSGFIGTGLDMRQIPIRMEFYKNTGIRTKLITFDKESDVTSIQPNCYEIIAYEAWLDELEASGDYIDTHGDSEYKKVRIYNTSLMTKTSLLYNGNFGIISSV